jgi:hypothetical protein
MQIFEFKILLALTFAINLVTLKVLRLSVFPARYAKLILKCDTKSLTWHHVGLQGAVAQYAAYQTRSTGTHPLLLKKCTFLFALHSTWDQRLFAPFKGLKPTLC